MGEADASAAEGELAGGRAHAMRSSGGRRRVLVWAPIAIAVALVARVAVRRVLAKVGHAGATLDDAYIHFQYARAIAEGHPFRYQAGAPPTSGATSLLWPALLAPFWLVGMRGDAIVWAAWALSFVALGGLAWEARELARGLAGDVAGLGAAAMVIAFPAFAWCAASGMEVVPFAWLLARSARRASEWAEGSAEGPARTRARLFELVALAWGAALMRPEGALASVAVAVVLARRPPEAQMIAPRGRVPAWAARGFAVAPLLAIAAPPLVLVALTGDARSMTAMVKLLPGNPYFPGATMVAAVAKNARQLVGELLDGGPMSAEFVPAGAAPFAMAGLAATVACGWRTKRLTRAVLVVGLALAMFVPCTYVTFLWNRLRYLWPFATGWVVGIACLARLLGDAAAMVRGRPRVVTALACGGAAGMLVSHMDWTLEDAAQSASGIDRQQVALGRWAKVALPADARIGVNDTGAIAYFGDRATFDVVGLTTKGEGRYWVAGAGSRLEHYERLWAAAPGALPTHFIVYPEWFGCEALLGEELQEAVVTDASILGGTAMRAHVAEYTLLGSGEAPWTPVEPIVDAVDVADLESEADHGYELLDAHDGEEIAGYGPAPDGRPMLDGGRTERTRERFVAHLRAGERAHGVARIETKTAAHARVLAGGVEIAKLDVRGGAWVEAGFDVPAEAARAETPIEVTVTGGALTVFHYWFTSASASASASAPAPAPAPASAPASASAPAPLTTPASERSDTSP